MPVSAGEPARKSKLAARRGRNATDLYVPTIEAAGLPDTNRVGRRSCRDRPSA